MNPSSVNIQPKQKPAKPQTISLPRDQVTADPIPGYTTEDFWRDFESEHGTPDDAFKRFEEFTRPCA